MRKSVAVSKDDEARVAKALPLPLELVRVCPKELKDVAHLASRRGANIVAFAS